MVLAFLKSTPRQLSFKDANALGRGCKGASARICCWVVVSDAVGQCWRQGQCCRQAVCAPPPVGMLGHVLHHGADVALLEVWFLLPSPVSLAAGILSAVQLPIGS
jgi:hypothetical protein